MLSREKYKDFLWHFGFWGAVAVLVFVFIRFLLRPMLPFIIAFTVAAFLQPVMRWLLIKLNLKPSREGIAAVVITVACYVVLVGLLTLAVIGLAAAVIDWASGLPGLFANTIAPAVENGTEELLTFIYLLNPEMGAFVRDMLPDVISTLSSTIMNISVSLVSWASSVGTKLPGVMLAAIICVIATTFLVKDYDMVVGKLLSVLPVKGQVVVGQIRIAVVDILVNFARSYLLILLITFMEVFVGLAIIGMENAAVIATMIALFDFMPILGSGMILLPWTIFTLLQGKITKGIGLLILWFVVVVARQIIEPRIVSKRVGLYPLVTLFFMWMGLKLFGGVGMLALPVIVLVIKDLYESGLLNIFTVSTECPVSVPTGEISPQ